MNKRTQAIREAARRMLEAGEVDVVLGYAKGTTPGRERPLVARTAGDADKLVWSGLCVGNVAKMLVGRKDRAGIVAQGCVSRNILGLIKENQTERERLKIIGVPCLGMLDFRKIAERFPGREILEIREEAADDPSEVVVVGRDFQERVPRDEVKRGNCLTCLHRNPVLSDVMAADPVDETMGGDIDRMAGPWENLEPAGRRERFEETFSACIRCNACRDVCPLCFCTTCFVDESRPQWCGKTQDPADVQTFHLLRALHCAGRCTDCGACESACPQGIKVRALTSKLEKDVRELYGYEPWLDDEAKPPLATFRPDDPQEFIK